MVVGNKRDVAGNTGTPHGNIAIAPLTGEGKGMPMTAGTGRDGRRRRVLNDGVRAASATADSEQAAADTRVPGTRTRRFAPEEGSVSFAVARGLLPTHGLAMTGVLAGGLLATAAILAGHHFRTALGPPFEAALDLGLAASLGRWMASSLMLLTGAMCLVIYGLRTNRTDDVRGLYRWWLAAGVACLAWSAIYTSQLHVAVGEYLAQATGFSPLAGGAFWWLLPLGITAGVLGFRPLADLRESKLSLTLTLAAGALFIITCCAAVGALPAAVAQHEPLVQAGSLLVGLVCGIGAQLSYVRRVLLETDGVIAAPKRKAKVKKTPKPQEVEQPKPTAAKPKQSAEQPDQPTAKRETKADPAPTGPEPKRPEREVRIASGTQWTDGSDGPLGDDEEGDSPRRKLSKAERKQLRKQKFDRYAA
jgi:hypothetical protein